MKYLILSLSFVIGLLFTGCSHTTELIKKAPPMDASEVNYSVTYYIHADSDYLYHTPDGDPIRDNSEVLKVAMEVGEATQSGEVLIFYQRSEKKLLGLFPRKKSRLYHYLNGELINQVKYRHPDKNEAFLDTEVQLTNQYRAQNRTTDHQNYFLYFGHEIPMKNNLGYHRSLPKIDVNETSFANGIQNFLMTEEDRFNLVVLSTCNNGTPEMAKNLIPFTDLMLASPQNLHLSHIDSDGLKRLESEPETKPAQLARSMAQQTVQRLDTTIHTTIALTLYELEDVKTYIHDLSSLTSVNTITDGSVQFQDNLDCAEVNAFETGAYRQGVETWYKPARFGRRSNQSSHSGWGCKPNVN